jgi:hypothetical protein
MSALSPITDAWSRLTPNVKRGIGAGLGLLVVVGLVVAALASGGDDEVATPPKRTTTTVSTTTTTPKVTTTTEPDVGPVAPLTGLRLANGLLAARPALAVKVDNLDAPRESALPQSGLPRADVVFEEIVEGNITRLVAVFQSQNAGRVGPVRSARTTDVHLLPQLGRPLLAWSGGNEGVTGAVRSSPSIIDLGHDAATSSYARDRGKRAPHNLFVQADELWGKAPGGLPAPPQMFLFRKNGQKQPRTAEPSQGVDLVWGSGGAASSPVNWRWDVKLQLYLRSQHGRPHVDADGTRLSAKNVVVLVTPYGRSAADTRSPEALTVGRGELFVYTAGKVIHGTWIRESEDKPASLYDLRAAPIFLSPGQTWVELPTNGGVISID